MLLLPRDHSILSNLECSIEGMKCFQDCWKKNYLTSFVLTRSIYLKGNMYTWLLNGDWSARLNSSHEIRSFNLSSVLTLERFPTGDWEAIWLKGTYLMNPSVMTSICGMNPIFFTSWWYQYSVWIYAIYVMIYSYMYSFGHR